MKFYSEITKKFYDNAQALEVEEQRIQAEQAAKLEAERKKNEERAIRAKEVEAAYQAKVEAEKTYFELRQAFIKDFGSYHMTFSSHEVDFNDLINDFLKIF